MFPHLDPPITLIHRSNVASICQINFFGLCGPGTMQFRNKYRLVIHNSGVRLYGGTNTGQHEYDAIEITNAVNPSIHNLNLIFLGSLAKSRNTLSKCFHVSSC